MSAVTAQEEATERVIRTFEALPKLASEDPILTRRGRFLTCDIEVGVGAVPLSISIVEGRVVAVRRGPFLLKAHPFSISAEPDVWLRFHQPMPAPGDHDLLALTKTGRARVSGDLVPFMGNLQYIKDLLALPRNLAKPQREAKH
ncbi:MAG: hypothetical protein R3D44_10490 [Hyphomicrobiaceae bacterium]